ncbi:MAG: acetolactate synthase large subunit [Bacillota bacterium]|nr:acetolactate synthase large subunit [Bacillota bacterium]
MKASDMLIRCLENEGVEYIFGIIGKEIIDIAHSLSKSKQIRFVPVRHEQAAAFMADIYGRVSGKPGVCLTTLGPGAANLLTGIASAYLDHSPVVALTGQKSLNVQYKPAHQYIDIQRIFEPVSKQSLQIIESNTVPEVIRRAFVTACQEKTGPVVLTIPENVASENCITKPFPITASPVSVPSKEALKTAYKALNQCERPFIIVGNGVIRGQAEKEAVAFIEKLGCPVTSTFMAKGVLSADDPQNYYTFGFQEKDYVLRGIEEADLLVVMGFDFNEKLPSEWNKKKAPIIHIDTVPSGIDEYYSIRAELVGTIKETLHSMLSEEIAERKWKPSANLKERLQTSFSIGEENIQNPALTIENILHVIERNANEQTIILCDVGSHKVSVARTLQPKHGKQLIISNGFASMGIAIPGAIGAKLASPEKKVICITGDGGALMNIAELETAKRLGLSFVIILLNDEMLKLEVDMMNQKFGESFGVSFTNPNFLELAESFKIKGARPKNIYEFESILQHGMNSITDITLIDAVMEQKV